MKFLPVSLRFRFTFLGILGSFISIIALSSYIVIEQRQQTIIEATKEAELVSSGLANAIVSYLIVKDYGTIDLTAKQYVSYPNLRSLYITNGKGSVILAAYYDEESQKFDFTHVGSIKIPDTENVQAEISGEHITQWVPVKSGTILGWIRIDLSLAHLIGNQNRIIRDSIIVAFFTITFLTVIIAFSLNKTINEIKNAANFASSLPKKLGNTLQKSSNSSELQKLISSLNKASQELFIQDENIKLATMVYQASSEGMVVTDSKNIILSVNPSFTLLTGYTPEEIIGKNSIEIFHAPENTKHFYKNILKHLKRTGRWQGEIYNKRKNGDKFIQWLTISSIYNDDGTLHRRVALFSDISEKKQSEKIIWEQANFDSLTKLPNRRMVYNILENEILKSRKTGQLLALMFLDLDRFKEVNDGLGHEAGDILLKSVSERMAKCLENHNIVGRLGGDEFIIILSNLQEKCYADHISEKILNELSNPFFICNQLTYISASIGITFYPDDAKDIDTLVRNADQAMYKSKNMGRNRFEHFTQSMHESAIVRMNIINDLHTAILKKQFRVYYQPIIDISTGCIVKAEALIRWNHPEKGFISPSEFIPVAEDTGLISKIGEWVFNEVLSQTKLLRKSYLNNFQISVNVSPAQFKDDWIKLIDTPSTFGKGVIIEITEGLLIEKTNEIRDQLLLFRNKGLQIALDDFGTGYSSLAYLKKFDIDYIKIDKSFINDLENSLDNRALCEAIIVMAHKLNIKVVAEGVENTAQLEILKQIHCDYGQGYLWSKPVTDNALQRLLTTYQNTESQSTPLTTIGHA